MTTGHIYVACGVGGLLKVGKTKDPRKRRKGLAREFRSKGDVLARFHPQGPVPNLHGAESALIHTISNHVERAAGREWFKHGNFEHAARAVDELAAYYAEEFRDWKPLTISEEAGAWLKAYRESRAKAKAQRALWRAQAEAAAALRRRLRSPGMHAFDSLVDQLRPDPTWPHPGGRPTIDVAGPAAAEGE